MKKEGQKVAGEKAEQSHQKRRGVPGKIQTVAFPDKGIKAGKEELAQKESDDRTKQKGHCPKGQAFSPEDMGNLSAFHAQEQVGCEFPAPFFHHEADHVLDQPG